MASWPAVRFGECRRPASDSSVIRLGPSWNTMFLCAGGLERQPRGMPPLGATEPIDSVIPVRYTGIVFSPMIAVQTRGRG